MNRHEMMRSRWLLVAAGMAVIGLLTSQASAVTWVGSVGSFTNGPNWDTGLVPAAGEAATVNNGGTAQFDGGTASVGVFSLGDALGMGGAFSMTAGTLTSTHFLVGAAGTGSVTQSGGDIVTSTWFADPAFGLAVFPGSAGSYLMSGGSLTLSGGEGNFQIGGHGTGTFTQTGGAVTGNNWIVLGRYADGIGNLTVSGGDFCQNDPGNAMIIGEGGVGFLTVTNAGTVSLNGGLRIGMVKTGAGDTGTGTGTVWLCQGGTISTPVVYTQGGSSTFYFEGGVLLARGSQQAYGSFFQGLSAAYVRSGGAVIDSGNNSVIINQNLLDGGGAGGLTKQGTGVLALGGANAYTGNTVVSNGVLAALTPGSLPGYSEPGKVKVSDGAGLSVGVGGSEPWNELQVYALAGAADFGSGCLFGLDTSLGSATIDAALPFGGLGLVKTGANVLKLTGSNSYTGAAVVRGGVLQADFGTGLSNLGNVTLNGGTLSSESGSLTQSLGSDAGQVNIVPNSAAGFSAYGTPLAVNLGSAGATLQWGSGAFSPSPLLLNEVGADSTLTLANGLDLAGGARAIAVNATASGAGATVTGNITDSVGGGGLTKSGAGTLTLAGTGAYTGYTYVNDGTVNLTAVGGYSLGEITVTGGGLNVGAAAVTQTTGNFIIQNGAASIEGGSVTDANGHGYIGVWWGSSLLSVNGGSFSVGNELNVGTWAGSTGAITLSDGAMSCATLYVGRGGNGTFTQTGGSVTRNGAGGEWRIGGEEFPTVAGTGVYNMQGGTLDTVGQNLQIGCSGNGTMNQTGGTVTCGGWPVVGRFAGGTGVYTLSGGTFNQTGGGNKLLASEHGTGTITVKGTGVANLTGGLALSSTGTGTVNLEAGGTINTPTVMTFGGLSTTFNFDGGLLRANGAGSVLPGFMSGLTTAHVTAGGARIDSNGKTITVAQNLSHNLAEEPDGTLLRHRWSFNGDLSDSVGGQTATAVGAVTTEGSQYRLAGDGSRGSSYIDLGANILPTDANTPCTIELWATQHAIQNWSRIIDFGSDQNNYILMAWTFGTDINHDHVELKTGGVVYSQQYTMAPYTLDTEWHIAMVLTPGAGVGGQMLAQWYKMDASGNTVKSGTMSANFSLANLTQANMWLGHSEWPDNDANASYNEVRIWNAALTEAQLRRNSLRGPDSSVRDGGLTKLGAGTLIVSGANSYNGPTVVSNGVLRLGSANAVPSNSEVLVAGGTYDLGGFAATNGIVTLEAGSIIGGTLVAPEFNLTDSGSVYATFAGAGNLTKSGTGTVTLAGSSTYAGETLIEEGTLATALPASALLRHRWSFNGDLSDSAAGQTATTVGAVTPNGAQYTLAGGAKGTSYIDLGANILPTDSTTPVTIELWASQHAIQNWSRIIDFGSDTANYILMAWTAGTDYNVDHVELQTGGVVSAKQATMAPYELNTEYHIALVLTPGAGTGGQMLAQWYKMDAAGNTLKSDSMEANFSLANLNQANMWLGHSEWPDNDASASYNEVRIWNGALTEAQLQASSLLGPNALLGSVSSGTALPADTRVTVASGATLDLVGGTQTVSGLAGIGLVTNGTLAVTGTIAPGGTNAIGTLTVAASTALTGTLLVDVALDGTSDLLKVEGNLDLTGLALQIQDVSQLKATKQYLIATCTPGGLTGPFEVTNLDAKRWSVAYDRVSGQVRLVTGGLLMFVR